MRLPSGSQNEGHDFDTAQRMIAFPSYCGYISLSEKLFKLAPHST
jgi:hypothetical protein